MAAPRVDLDPAVKLDELTEIDESFYSTLPRFQNAAELGQAVEAAIPQTAKPIRYSGGAVTFKEGRGVARPTSTGGAIPEERDHRLDEIERLKREVHGMIRGGTDLLLHRQRAKGHGARHRVQRGLTRQRRPGATRVGGSRRSRSGSRSSRARSPGSLGESDGAGSDDHRQVAA